jgi:hypothetical protein
MRPDALVPAFPLVTVEPVVACTELRLRTPFRIVTPSLTLTPPWRRFTTVTLEGSAYLA